MRNDIEMHQRGRTQGNDDDDDAQIQTPSESKLNKLKSILNSCCHNQSTCQRACIVTMIVILICVILSGVAFILIEVYIMPFKIDLNRQTTVVSTTSSPSTIFYFTIYTTADQNSTFFEDNSTNG
jgi:hypothetical protein